MANTDKIIELAEQKATDKEKRVYEAISRLKSKYIELSVANIANEAGCSRKYIYSKPDLIEYIKREQLGIIVPPDTLSKIQQLEEQISNLEKENKQLKKSLKDITKDNDETYKQKYEKVKSENDELKKQLRKAYEYFPNDNSNFT